MSQIYKAARIYTNSFNQMMPDLFAGLLPADHLKRYVKSNAARNTATVGTSTVQVPCGLWLLYTGKFADAKEVFYCPDVPGPRRFGGSENAVVDKLPETLSYMYNCYPEMATGDDALPLPDGLLIEDVSNDSTQQRNIRFYGLITDSFLKSTQLPHLGARGTNCCYWDGSVQWISLTARGFVWNTKIPDPEDASVQIETYTEDKAGATLVRDNWIMLSESRH
jgi:hypothetical protein